MTVNDFWCELFARSVSIITSIGIGVFMAFLIAKRQRKPLRNIFNSTSVVIYTVILVIAMITQFRINDMIEEGLCK